MARESHAVPSSSLASATSLLLWPSYSAYTSYCFVTYPTQYSPWLTLYLTYHTYVTCFRDVCLELIVILMACGPVSVSKTTKLKTKANHARPKNSALRPTLNKQTWNWVIGSPGQWVIWVIFHAWVIGSPGHHFDPVWDPSFSGFRKSPR